jgi:endonuclease/exonuclease/phosphatase family metal-dependent hydrolase
MRLSHIVVFITLFFLQGIYVSVKAQSAFRLKVMSFNVRMSGELTSYNVEPYATLIKKYNPDVIALQEVDYKASRSGNKDFATELGAALGMFPVFGKTISIGTGEYGIAILSKYPLGSTEMQILPKPEGTKEQRGVLITTIPFPSGHTLKFVCTHLDHSSDAIRTIMANTLNALFLTGNTPTIMGGDFNAQPSESAIATTLQPWKRLCTDEATFPNIPTTKIDYLFGYPKASWTVISYQVIKKTDISDHCPILAEVEFK